MPTTVEEFFGFRWDDKSQVAASARATSTCPFLGAPCQKTLNDGTPSGVCALRPVSAGSKPVICCPIRLYADDYQLLRTVADLAFGRGLPVLPPDKARHLGRPAVAAFGHRWGGELRLPARSGVGSYFVDWILAKVDSAGDLVEFVAVEIQTIDTTGNYRNGISALRDDPPRLERNTAGFNWENVNKRILPQLIYKGHVLQREPLCRGGLFFVAPAQIYTRIMDRLGGEDSLAEYPLQSSSITFLWYELDEQRHVEGEPTPLRLVGKRTTNVGQVAQAFVAPPNLPDMGVYESAIREALRY